MSEGKVVKMVIEAYEKPTFSGKAGEFELQVNPENYKRTFQPASGAKALVLSNGETAPSNFALDLEKLTLTFLLDSTGIIPGCDDVQGKIDDLKKLCLEVNGKIHRANYLKVRWDNSFVFRCVMKSLSIDYQLFKPDGSPVRANLTATFEEFIDPVTKAREDNTNSPDLTHVETVRKGDNLPLMCYRIYGDSKYYLQIARHNDLLNLYQMEPGRQITFPPLDDATITA